MRNERNLLATLANEAYIDQAKQLFSSVYWNAGWKGDYMLLAHEIPEGKLKWFRDKGILVKKCKPLADFYPAVRMGKFYLFTPEFKKWSNIVYLDADIIVRASLDDLTMVKGFGAVTEAWNNRLSYQIIEKKFIELEKRGTDEKTFDKLSDELKKNYQLNRQTFNSGVMAFNTDIIKEDTFLELNNLFKKYSKISFGVDQLIFNLFFYKKWKKLFWVYNIYPLELRYRCGIHPKKIRGIIVHFIDIQPSKKCRIWDKKWKKTLGKPWNRGSPFYQEWQDNFKNAELINLTERPLAKKIWAAREIYLCVLYLNLMSVLYYLWIISLAYRILPYIKQQMQQMTQQIQHMIQHMTQQIHRGLGAIGIFLKKHNPNLYFKLKKIMHKKIK
jgi:lipopolysaccharide biosynthesis glycosyltransferase